MKYFKNEGRSEFLEFLRGFELKKRMFNKDSMKKVVLKIPPALVDILSEKNGEEFEEKFKTLQQNKTFSFSGDKLNIEYSLFASFFESSMNYIIFHIEDIFNAEICRDLVGVVMVGGFLESMFVNSAVEKAFPGKKFITLMEAGLAVAMGAVRFGHDPEIILSRTFRYTYGHDTGVPFDISIHPKEKLNIIERKLFCKDIFSKFYTIGQQESLAEAVEETRTYSFVDEYKKHLRDELINENIFISKKEAPIYVDESGCELLGKIIIECKNDEGKWPERVFVKTRMEIAGTEIKVTATTHTGESVNASFEFL